MLEAHDLKKQFISGATPLVIFEHLNVAVQAGEFVVLTGRSGSGKSTLLYALGLLDTPSAGTITIDGESASTLSRHARTALRLERFGYIFQDYGLMPEMSALERVGLAEHCLQKPAKLSGGQQQRVSIARAIAHNPAYLLADEPTANLDATSAGEILQMFGEIHRAGATIIMVTHEKESLALASRVLELQQGKLIDIGSAQSPVASPSGI